MNRTRIVFVAVFLALGAWVALAAPAPKTPPAVEPLYQQVELLAEAITVIQSEYVEQVDPQKMIYGALKGLVESLDRHSQFMDPQALSEMQIETHGEFAGLGLEIALGKDGVLTVIAPLDDSPAARAGVRPGDKIVKINGESTRGIALQEAVNQLRGRSGSKVSLSLFRDPENKAIDVTLVRSLIHIRSVRDAVPAPGIGYIRISEFQENTEKDFEKALTGLEKKVPLEGLILDLRNNPGGLLESAVAVAGFFLPEGKLVLSTKGRAVGQTQQFFAKRKDARLALPIVVLVNGGSASAAEILAGALRDTQRAVLIGMKTFGKGSVQTLIPLRDGSALRLTTSLYYMPSGRTIHGKGIEPDVIVDQADAVSLEDESPASGSSGLAKDPVVLRAIDLLKAGKK